MFHEQVSRQIHIYTQACVDFLQSSIALSIQSSTWWNSGLIYVKIFPVRLLNNPEKLSFSQCVLDSL